MTTPEGRPLLNPTRRTNATFKLDLEGLRRGFYSDRYFENVVAILSQAGAASGYTVHSPARLNLNEQRIFPGQTRVEAQIFHRRAPRALVAGVDAALALLRHAAGRYAGDNFVETWRDLEVEAVADGTMTEYDGHPDHVLPVIRVRGRYQDFALLETPLLGLLSRATRIATNVYNVLEVANGKPVLFFPARFDLPEVQALDGYAYWLAVQHFNQTRGAQMVPAVSTDAQAAWWGGRGMGTVPHALIAAFLGDTVAAMLAYAEQVPVEVSRTALVDFNNDVVGDSLATLSAYWPRYQAALASGDQAEQRRWTLNAVRLDTAANLRDVSLEPDGPTGVNPQLVRWVRQRLDDAWQGWDVGDYPDAARAYCRNVRIVVTGGFTRERIEQFEREGVPVDSYGVGSSLFRNDPETNTDFTMDVVRVELDGRWVNSAKVGRQPNENPALQPVDLGAL